MSTMHLLSTVFLPDIAVQTRSNASSSVYKPLCENTGMNMRSTCLPPAGPTRRCDVETYDRSAKGLCEPVVAVLAQS